MALACLVDAITIVVRREGEYMVIDSYPGILPSLPMNPPDSTKPSPWSQRPGPL